MKNLIWDKATVWSIRFVMAFLLLLSLSIMVSAQVFPQRPETTICRDSDAVQIHLQGDIFYGRESYHEPQFIRMKNLKSYLGGGGLSYWSIDVRDSSIFNNNNYGQGTVGIGDTLKVGTGRGLGFLNVNGNASFNDSLIFNNQNLLYSGNSNPLDFKSDGTAIQFTNAARGLLFSSFWNDNAGGAIRTQLNGGQYLNEVFSKPNGAGNLFSTSIGQSPKGITLARYNITGSFYTALDVDSNAIRVGTTISQPSFRGILMGADYSANYLSHSLVDSAFVGKVTKPLTNYWTKIGNVIANNNSDTVKINTVSKFNNNIYIGSCPNPVSEIFRYSGTDSSWLQFDGGCANDISLHSAQGAGNTNTLLDLSPKGVSLLTYTTLHGNTGIEIDSLNILMSGGVTRLASDSSVVTNLKLIATAITGTATPTIANAPSGTTSVEWIPYIRRDGTQGYLMSVYYWDNKEFENEYLNYQYEKF